MKKLFLTTALISSLIVTSASAQPFGGGERREMIKQKMQERVEQRKSDTNETKKTVSKEEFMAEAESRFAKLDSDGDKKVTQQERPLMFDKLKQADSDNNGAVSIEEFMAQAESRFGKMDTNGDGQITQEERAAMPEQSE